MDARPNNESDTGLRRSLTRWHALAIVVGSILGTGIYIRPASIAQWVGTPAWIVVVWIGTGLLSLAGAMTYSQLVARFPRPGGEYAFLQQTLGDFPAFLYGWARLTVGAGVVAALAVAATVFLSDLVPLGRSWGHIAASWLGNGKGIELGPRQLVATLLIASLAALNTRGVGNAGRFQSAMTILKVAGLVGLIGAIVLLGHGTSRPTGAADVVARGPDSAGAVGAAALAAMAAYNGWANVAMIGGEVSNPERNLPWALVLGMSMVIGLYVTVNIAFLHVLPLHDILTANSSAHPEATSVASRAATVALGLHAGTVLSLLFMISAIGTLHCNMLAVPRIFFAMARDGLLPAFLGRASVRSGSPSAAIVVFALMAGLFAVIGGYDRLADMSAFAFVFFFAFNAAGFLWWQFSGRSGEPRLAWRHQLVAAFFLLGTVWLLTVLVMRGSVETLAALLMMGAGLPVYAWMRSARRMRFTSPRRQDV